MERRNQIVSPDVFRFARDRTDVRVERGFDVDFRVGRAERSDAFFLLFLQISFRMTKIGKNLRQFVDDDIVVADRGDRLKTRRR